ncbi:DJ-1/PfpI family protein [Pendulispora albinea]|uniref:DJ-1/PfpI family protein n=1 Tax=Pendulispora albinea TaxID=2741071 RepID=A0ABZ2M301_9BACT
MAFQIGFLVFPKLQQLDLTGPYELFAEAKSCNVHLLWKNLDRVRSSTGLEFTPTMTFADCPALDLLCLPGGAGVNALMQDDEVLDFVRARAASTRYVASVCTGALVLGAAGILKGRRATTHWASHHFLEPLGAIPVRARVVRDGHVFTGGGVTAGIDLGLTVLAELAGRLEAETVQLNLEYAPEPPFSAGNPDTAPQGAVDAVNARLAAALQARASIVAELTRAGARHPSSS